MKCNISHNELSAFFDGELPPRKMKKLESHLLQCDSCQEVLHAMNLIKNSVEKFEQEKPSPHLVSRVMGHLQAPRRRTILPKALVVALLLLVIVSGNLTERLIHQNRIQIQPEVIRNTFALSSFDALPNRSLGQAYLIVMERNNE